VATAWNLQLLETEGDWMVKDKNRKTGRKSINISGRCFGRLVAEYKTDRRDYKGSVYWHCGCDCGNEIDVTADGLRTGNNRSCCCLKKENQVHVHERLHRIDGTCLEWIEKRKNRSDNTSGYRGVFRMKNGRYRVSIGFQGKRYYLGTYEDLGDAVAARQKAEHEIHEAFAEAYHAWDEHASREPQWGVDRPFFFEVVKNVGSGYRVICKDS